MALKYVIVAALLVAAASAGLIAPSAYQLPQLTAAQLPVKLIREEPRNPHPQYSYGYEVHDPNTGDVKSQHETRDGGVVRGSYSLIEADGSKRTVKYTADEYHGFNAVVEKEPAKIAVTQAPAYNFKPIAYQPEPTIAHPQLTETEVQAFLDQHYGQQAAFPFFQN